MDQIQPVNVVFGLIAVVVYLYVGWIWPIQAIKKANKRNESTTFPGVMMAVFGILPIIILLILLWKSQKSANGNNGGTPPPNGEIGGQPTNALGSETANVK